ncbi:hypothetical protein B4U78_015020 [Microbacterium esteraromaticum]|nr:hypothetical protein B4U78_015020 [Microbacterium esteraromaticum]
MQHIIHHLSEEGIAVFLVPQKELDSTGNRRLRKGIIETDLVEAIITLPKNSVYKETSQLAILVINKNKREKVEIRGEKSRTYRKRIKEILFIDAREEQKVKRGKDPQITKEKSE